MLQHRPPSSLAPLNILQANNIPSYTQNNSSYATTPGGMQNKTSSLLGTVSIPHLSQTQEILIQDKY
jgi:hypothetical protein